MTTDQFLLFLKTVYESEERWPKPFHLLEGYTLTQEGMAADEAAKLVGTNRRTLEGVVTAADPVSHVLGSWPDAADEPSRKKAHQQLGQMLVGRCAELAFEKIYKDEMHTQELELRDLRESRSNTDYRLLNGGGRPIYRINIKFHGSPFRRAEELVQLQSDDCFALATYKIQSALKAQDEDELPYLFVIVGVPNLTGLSVGEGFPDTYVDALSILLQAQKRPSVRDFEDRLVEMAVNDDLPVFRDTYARLESTDWYVLSARRAYNLLREKLFERVYALRIRGFAQQFRSAELDMHFSLKDDLTPLADFLGTLSEHGMTKVTTLLERGEY
jgi:hypothetical protein